MTDTASQQRTWPSNTPNGQDLLIPLAGRSMTAYKAVHASGSGPGLILIGDQPNLTASIKSRAELMGEEGYAVLALPNGIGMEELRAAADTLQSDARTEGKMALLSHGPNGALACEAARSGCFEAIVAFDATDLAHQPDLVADLPCPIALQFAADHLDPRIHDLTGHLNKKDGSRLFIWENVAPGFALPGHQAFDKRTDDLAHTRTLELIRRVVGPYYDYAALFAEHTYHEFTTRDVDATMATMIDEPYVNHVPTLAGGVGHDMLKRFYKYHFVDQNAGGRDRERISYTVGANRLVLESYTKFRHDAVIDRYFPGIAPTGKVVEIATVIIVKFRGDKVCHEHLYWDQGSALKQIGVLDAKDLPLAGAEAARKVRDEHLPSNIFMQDAWKTSEGKPL